MRLTKNFNNRMAVFMYDDSWRPTEDFFLPTLMSQVKPRPVLACSTLHSKTACTSSALRMLSDCGICTLRASFYTPLAAEKICNIRPHALNLGSSSFSGHQSSYELVPEGEQGCRLRSIIGKPGACCVNL